MKRPNLTPRRRAAAPVRILIVVRRWELLLLLLLAVAGVVGWQVYRRHFASTDAELVSTLGGNLFPSQILATAATDEAFILPADTPYVGRPQGLMGIRLRSRRRNTHVQVELAETPFYSRSVSEFVLPRAHADYVVYPDVVWNYDALRANVQPTPISVLAHVTVERQALPQVVRTFSVRSVNECLLGYYRMEGARRKEWMNTRQLFAAYVNEDSPLIDEVLREALNLRLVNRFMGYQGDSAHVVAQVYAMWNVLQRRRFRYSSISNSSLSSNIVFAQRVRTVADALRSGQVNCVDGSVLFASLMRAVNIDPILVKLPGHMFVGFYTDRRHTHAHYVETTMIGDVNLDDYFPEEQLDSTMQHLTQNQASRMTFAKSMEYAEAKYQAARGQLARQSQGYMLLEITDAVRRRIQPIGK